MRIDAIQVAAMINQQDLASLRRTPLQQPAKPVEAAPQTQQPKAPPVTVPAPTQMNVSIDSDKNVIYQFLDAHTGEIVQQVPPEEVLQVMRSIADMLRHAEQKLNISI
jgi:uncharacterized iron-regulated membrane protein